MTNVSGNIRKRSNGYQITLELPVDSTTGKRKRIYKTVHVKTQKEATKIMREMMAEYESDSYIRESKVTVGEWLNDWMKLYVDGKLSQSTVEGYRQSIDAYITPRFGDTYLQQLKTQNIQEWCNTLKSCKTGKPLATKTVKNALLVLSAACHRACMLEMIRRNPCENVELPKLKKYQADVYDTDEIEELLDAVEGTDMNLPIYILLMQGLRRSEMLALTWDDIDFDNCRMTINKALIEVDKKMIVKQPKTVSGNRILDIPPTLLDLIREAHRKYLMDRYSMGNKFEDNNLVVCQPDGKPFMPDSFSHKWRRFVKDKSLKRIRLHDLRHTNTTIMLTSGVSAKAAQARLGHSDYSTTMNIYSHVLAPVEHEAAVKIDDVIVSAKHA